MTRRRIIIASLTDHRTDARIARQIRLLRDDYEVISASPFPATEVESVVLPTPVHEKTLVQKATTLGNLLARRFQSHYHSRPWVREAATQLARTDSDLILVNDLPLMPVCVDVAGHRPVLFDAHEYYPSQHENRWKFRYLFKPYQTALCKAYVPRTAGMLTVSPGLRDQYEKLTGVRAQVVRNTPDYRELLPSACSSKPLRLVHHGIAQPRRSLELLIDVAKELGSDYELHLVLRGKPKYLKQLRMHASGHDNVVFHEAVPNAELCQYINQFDVGIAFFPPVTFNLLHCLPNKLFEFINARLGVVIGPSPDMAAVVREADCGEVSPEFTSASLLETIRALTADRVATMKANSHVVAWEHSWHVDKEVLRGMVASAVEGDVSTTQVATPAS